MGALTRSSNRTAPAPAPTPVPQANPVMGTGNAPFQQAAQAQQMALGGTAAGMQYQPQQVSTGFGAAPVSFGGGVGRVGTGGTIQRVGAGQLASTNLAPYMNPYQQNVIGGLQTEANRAAQMATNQLGAQAQAAGAFGGSRQAIAQGQMMGDIQRGLNQQVGQLMQSGYGQAQAAAQQDIATRMQAAQLNQAASQADLARRLQAQGMNVQAAQDEAARRLQAGQLNQAATLQAQGMRSAAQQANQAAGLTGAQQRLGAAQQLAGLGQQSFGYGQAIQQNLAQQGAQQQALNQALIDASKAQYQGYTTQPLQSLNTLMAAIGATPTPMSSQTNKQVGLFDYLTLAATAYGSDIRLKKNIKKVGVLPNGLGVYTWEWKDKVKDLKGNFSMTKGVMAQEAQKVIPDAVIKGVDGYLMVDYSHPELSGVA